jgi:two-component system, OmpR family, alkaline phosphatase synthesis response regulator PhoP
VSHTVLIADDEPHIRLLLEQTLDELDSHDVEIITATNGGDALRSIREARPAVVLLDVMMPVMNGFDVCRAVKSDPELKGIFIVLLTAKGQELDRATGAEVGADLYLTKPFDPDDVLARVAKVLGVDLG